MNGQKLRAIGFIKALCALGVIVYHFSCHLTSREFLPFFLYANGNWGSACVTVFFMVSGGLLYHRYADNYSLKQYCRRRWLSIFPMFYLAYAYYEIEYMINHGTAFYRGNPLRYGFTLLGIDGYLANTTTTYYILGEWFLGAIIVLYALFPLLLKLSKKSDAALIGISAALYALECHMPVTNPVSFWSVSSCLISFTAGMMLIKYRRYVLRWWTAILSLAACAFLATVKLPVTGNVGNHLMGLFGFIALYGAGEQIMKLRPADRLFTRLGNLSYAVFLVHHVEMLDILSTWNPATVGGIVLMEACSIALILFKAWALTLVTNRVLELCGALRFDRVKEAFHRMKEAVVRIFGRENPISAVLKGVPVGINRESALEESVAAIYADAVSAVNRSEDDRPDTALKSADDGPDGSAETEWNEDDYEQETLKDAAEAGCGEENLIQPEADASAYPVEADANTELEQGNISVQAYEYDGKKKTGEDLE